MKKHTLLLLFVLSMSEASLADSKISPVLKSEFGKLADGTKVDLFTLTNSKGAVAKITNYGATVTDLEMPDRKGKLADVVLGLPSFADYLAGHPHLGPIAGRYANRIAGGAFRLNGKEYKLFINNGPNSLHGGKVGFDKVIWKSQIVQSKEGPSVKLTYLSKDGEEGYPGNLTVTCTYTLTDKNELKIELDAQTDQTTVLNLTNHSYFNLAGESSGTILDHQLTLNASHFTPVDDAMIPTGEIKDVHGTVMDFTKPRRIGERIRNVPGNAPGGYDHNFVIDGGGKGKLVRAARLKDPQSGRTMETWTTQPGVQVYTSNFLDGKISGVGGKPYVKNAAVCLETQHFPDSPNHPEFPSTVLKPGEKFHEVTVYRFGVEK